MTENMKDKKRVACFFTGGYTELNAMKTFVKKINANAEYTQICPVASRKSRDDIRNRVSIKNNQNGLTGDALIEFVLNAIEKTYFIRESYDAILIEDDKDSRFLNEDTGTIDQEKWTCFKENISRRIKEKGVTVPVVILLAAPEIEAWFISDWKNSFGQVYRNSNGLNGHQNAFFSNAFRKHIRDKVLTKKYFDTIEAYGYFSGTYKKLSEEIQRALESNDFFEKYETAFKHEDIRYSKRKQGEIMLESIDPNTVIKYCTVFFKEAFYELQNV